MVYEAYGFQRIWTQDVSKVTRVTTFSPITTTDGTEVKIAKETDMQVTESSVKRIKRETHKTHPRPKLFVTCIKRLLK